MELSQESNTVQILQFQASTSATEKRLEMPIFKIICQQFISFFSFRILLSDRNFRYIFVILIQNVSPSYKGDWKK